MEFTLSTFRDNVDPTWIHEAMSLRHHIGPLQWPYEGTVITELDLEEGVEVIVELEGDEVLGYSCTCPGEAPICLHVVAVLCRLCEE